MNAANTLFFFFVVSLFPNSNENCCHHRSQTQRILHKSHTNAVHAGHRLARLPVDPMFGRCLIVSGELGCSEEMLAVVAMVSCDAAVFVSPREKQEEAAEAHRRFSNMFGDHCTALTVFSGWSSSTQKERWRWCGDNFLNARALKKAGDIHQQLRGHLEDLKVPLKSCGDDLDPLRRALVAGLFPHAAKRQVDGTYRVVASGQSVHLHPSSVLHGKRKPECIVFTELVRTTRQYVRGVTCVEASWLPELAPAYFARKQAN